MKETKTRVEELRETIAHLAKLAGFHVSDVLSSDLLPLEELVKQESDAVEQGQVDPFPWLTLMLEWEGKDEVDDNAELQKFLGVDPEDTPWCAAMLTTCLGQTGQKYMGLRARDYAQYGEEGDGTEGDIAVWRSHVGVVVNEQEVIGGNVSNEVKRSPHPSTGNDWFKNFIGFRRVV